MSPNLGGPLYKSGFSSENHVQYTICDFNRAGGRTGQTGRGRSRIVELQVSVLPLLTILLSCSNRDSSKRDLNLRRLNER